MKANHPNLTRSSSAIHSSQLSRAVSGDVGYLNGVLCCQLELQPIYVIYDGKKTPESVP